jgi:hypothetical protein
VARKKRQQRRKSRWPDTATEHDRTHDTEHRARQEHQLREKRLRPYRSAQGFFVAALLITAFSFRDATPERARIALLVAFLLVVLYAALIVYDPPRDPEAARRLMARFVQCVPGEIAVCAWVAGKDVRVETTSSFWEIAAQMIAALMIALAIDLRGFAFPRFAASLPGLVLGPVALFAVVRGGYDCLEALMARTEARASVGFVCAAIAAQASFLVIRVLTAHFEERGYRSPFGPAPSAHD